MGVSVTNLPVPVPAQEAPGNLITGALWNANVYNGLSFLVSPPYFAGNQQTAQSVAHATWTALTIDTETDDAYGGHSNTTNPSRYVPQVPGRYLVIAGAAWAGNVTGSRRCRVALNGVQVNPFTSSMTDTGASNSSSEIAVAVVRCNGTTDYIEAHGQQNSGAALSTAGGGGCTLVCVWLTS